MPPPLKLKPTHFGFAVIVLGLCALALFSRQGFTMSLFGEKQKVVVSSPLEGTLTYQGNPASGAQVERFLRWKDQDGEITTVKADEKGRFKLPAREDEVKISPLSRFVIHQKITVRYKGDETVIWSIGTASREIYGELGEKPNNFRCELTDEPYTKDMENGLLYTICKWS